MSNVDVAKAEIKDWLKRKLLPKKKVHYDEPPIEQKTLFPVQSKKKAPSGKTRYGGVVVLNGKVLLVNPTNNFGNYAWTFPKGGAGKNETPEEAAIREVEEESGYICKVIKEIPGKFAGTTSDNKYFLMRPIKQGEHGWETEQVDWATFNQAKKMIMQTGILGNITGMRRDLQILHAAFGKELYPEELKTIEDRANELRREEAKEREMLRDKELKDKLGDEGFLQYKAYQAETRKRMAELRAKWAEEERENAKKKSILKAKRKEELLRFKLGDRGYEDYMKFLADQDEAKRQKAKAAVTQWQQYQMFPPGTKYKDARPRGGLTAWPSQSSDRCFRCSASEVKKTGALVTCLQCGAQWLDKKAGKPVHYVQKKFQWPEDRPKK